jgi:hypothetical protein
MNLGDYFINTFPPSPSLAFSLPLYFYPFHLLPLPLSQILCSMGRNHDLFSNQYSQVVSGNTVDIQQLFVE